MSFRYFEQKSKTKNNSSFRSDDKTVVYAQI